MGMNPAQQATPSPAPSPAGAPSPSPMKGGPTQPQMQQPQGQVGMQASPLTNSSALGGSSMKGGPLGPTSPGMGGLGASGYMNGLYGMTQGYNGGMGSLNLGSSSMNPTNPLLQQGGGAGGSFPLAYPAQMNPSQPQ